MSPDFERVKAVFQKAVDEYPPEEWDDYLDSACGSDADLRHEVSGLLRAHKEGGSRLDSPVFAVNGTTTIASLAEGHGTVIGPYKLLQQIGEGGMGVVFMAEQTEPIDRTVALKIIKPGMDTRQVIARFEAERQALAMMDHPNIAKVHDAGMTETGRPYFVMELVKGVPINKYCDEKQLPLRERLELFRPICQAVQHAHQKGIIHRDLKPTNVLVAEYDNHAIPKVIDFGVAKATAQRLTERTMFTELGQVLGTVEYMSPEQAELNHLDIDTRSDIYSLGVLLYELLTGSTPFEQKRLREAAFDEVLRIIREEEPPKPSTRLSTSDTLPSIAAKRHTEPARLSKEVHGELDWIVMKCLEKDRNRRYDTATGLARDIERYLLDEPVQACPPSAAYRFRKFARRNKGAVFVASSALAILLLAVTGLGISNRLITAQRHRAEANFLRARDAVGRILSEAAGGAGKWGNIPPQYRKLIANEAINTYQEFLQEDSTDPSLQFETAVVFSSIGNMYRSLSEMQPAEEFVRRSITILDGLASTYPHNVDYRDRLAYSQYTLGQVLQQSNRPAEGEDPVEQAVATFEDRTSNGSDSTYYWTQLGRCYGLLVQLQQAHGDSGHAELTIQRLVDLGSKLPPALANSVDIRLKFAAALTRAGRSDKAISIYQEVIRLRPKYQYYSVLGDALCDDCRFDEAIDAYEESIRLKPGTINARCGLCRVLGYKGRLNEAEAVIRKAIEIQPNISYLYDYLGSVLLPQGKLDEAAAAWRTAIELDPSTATAQVHLVRVLREQGKLDEAEAILQKGIKLLPNDANKLRAFAWYLATAPNAKDRDARRAVDLATRATELAPQDANLWNTLGVAHYRAGHWQDSIAAIEKTMNLRAGRGGFDWFFLAMAQWQSGHKEEARKWYDTAVEFMDKNALKTDELRRFRKEAAELIGITEPQPSIKPAAESKKSSQNDNSTTPTTTDN